MQKKTLYIILGIVLFITIPIAIFFIYATQSLLFTAHGYISVAAVPSPVHVVTKGRSTNLETNQKYPVEVGSNTIVFSADGFESKTIHITIKKDETSTIPVQLTPITDAAKKEAADQKYQNTLQQITAINKTEQVKDLQDNNPILSQLPIEKNNYTITPCNQEGSTISICINTFIPGTKYMQQDGLTELKSLGYDLSNYNIYVDGSLYSKKSTD